MKTHRRTPWTAHAALFSAAVAVHVTVPSLTADTHTWDGGGNNSRWSTAGNWTSNAAPVNGDSLVFSGTSRLTPTNTTSNGSSYLTSVGSVTFNSDGFTIGGGSGSLTLLGASVGGTTIGINDATSGSAAWNINSTLGASQSFVTTSGGTLSLGGTLATAGYTLTVDGAGDTSIAGVVSGGGSLIKTGSGTLTISGANTYTGGTTLSAGTLSLGSSGAVGSTGSLKFSGGTLQFSAANTSDYASRIKNSTGAVTLDTNSQNVTFAGVIDVSNTGGLTKRGSGTLTLSGANTYTGGTNINAGILKVNNTKAIGGGVVTVASGAVLDLNNQTIAVDALSGSGTVRNDANGGTPTTESQSTISVGSTGASSTSSTFSGSIQNGSFLSGTSGYQTGMGVVNLTKTGSGTLTLTGQNSYTGKTDISGGTLAIQGTGTVGNVGQISIASGASLAVNRSADYSLASSLTGAGTLTKQGNATLTLTNTNSLTGTVDIQGGKVVSSTSASLGTGKVNLANGTTVSLGGDAAVTGFSNGTGWTFNGKLNGTTSTNGNAIASTDSLVVTSQQGSQASATYLNTPVDVTKGYTVNYVYLTRGGNSDTGGRADGVAFILQNDSRGTTAIGGHGSGNGYAAINGGTAITNSDILVLDTHTLSQTDHVTNGAENSSDAGSSRHWGNGTSASDPLSFDNTATPIAGLGGSGSVNLTGLQPIQVSLAYTPGATAGTGTLVETLTNLTTGAVYTRTYNNVDVAAATNAAAHNGTAYLGFTGGTGSLTAWQTVSGFTFSTNPTSGTYANAFSLADGASATIEAAAPNITIGSLQMGSGATLNTTASATFGSQSSSNLPYSIATSATGTVSLNGTNTFNVVNNGTGIGTLRLNNVSGGSLVKSGNGVLEMGGANNYSGTTEVQAGTLRALVDNAFGASSELKMTGGLAQINGHSVAVGGLSGSAGTVENAGSTLGVLSVGSANTNTTFSGTLRDGTSGGSLALTKTGSGTLILSGNNTYTGGTAINAGILNAGSSNALGTTGNISFAGGTLQYSAANQADYSTRIHNSTSAVSIDTNGQNVTFAGSLDSTNNHGLTKLGTGTLTLKGTNAFSGKVTVANGALNTASYLSMGQPSSVTLGDTSTKGTIVYGDSIGGVFSIPMTVASGGGQLDIPNASTRLENTNVISGSGKFTKGGLGTLVLSGNNTYTGATEVAGGSLIVNGSTAAGSAVTVDRNATLAGNGHVNGTVAVSGTIAPGDPASPTTPATLTTGAQTWNTGGTYQVDINSTTGGAGVYGDLLVMSGITQNAGFKVQVTGTPSGFTPTTSIYQWIIAATTSGTFNINKLSLDVSGFLTGQPGYKFSLFDQADPNSKYGSSTHDLVLKYDYAAVPEATTLLLGLAGLTPMLLQRRNRRPTRMPATTA